MAISKESADAINANIKILLGRKDDILAKVADTQKEIDNLTKRRDQIQSEADSIDDSIAKMKTDLDDGGTKK